MKTSWKHINFEQMKTISSSIKHNFKLIQIANILDFYPTSISKEVKRNRVHVNIGRDFKSCNKLNRWPFVCDNCKFKYDPKIVQSKATADLINSRKGLDINNDDFKLYIDMLIRVFLLLKELIYHMLLNISLESIIKSMITLITI